MAGYGILVAGYRIQVISYKLQVANKLVPEINANRILIKIFKCTHRSEEILIYHENKSGFAFF